MHRFALLSLVGLAAACGHDAGTADACPAGAITLDVSGPDTFRCQEPYRATFTVSNLGCQTIEVSSIEIASSVTSSTETCAAAAPSTYPPLVASIAPGKIAVVADVTGDPFCCTPGPCPADYQCDEEYDYRVVTSAGTLTETVAPIHIELPACDVTCR